MGGRRGGSVDGPLIGPLGRSGTLLRIQSRSVELRIEAGRPSMLYSEPPRHRTAQVLRLDMREAACTNQRLPACLRLPWPEPKPYWPLRWLPAALLPPPAAPRIFLCASAGAATRGNGMQWEKRTRTKRGIAGAGQRGGTGNTTIGRQASQAAHPP